METRPAPFTEGEMQRIAEGLRAVADVQEKAIPGSFMSAKIGTATRLRAMVSLLRMGANAIEQQLAARADDTWSDADNTLANQLVDLVDIEDALAQQKLDDQP